MSTTGYAYALSCAELIHGETPTQQDKGVIRKLTRKEILTQEGNAFQVPLVQKYIEQLLEEE
ncbi:hypothetical protein [Nostoc sp.]|uniref:hypothetical protein n=1 Tax=Nostoc sp. TaxID=1180 RepID=UPI002FF01453